MPGLHLTFLHFEFQNGYHRKSLFYKINPCEGSNDSLGGGGTRATCLYSPAAKGGNPKISDIVFLSLDYSSLGCI